MKRVAALFLMSLIIGISLNTSITFAQSQSQPESSNVYDLDSDGVCDRPRNDPYHEGKTGYNQLRCDDTLYGDLCLGTSGSNVGRGELNSGCSPDQVARKYDFWSVSRDGGLQPEILKVNWLTDSLNGVLVYQPIKLAFNSRFEAEDVELGDVFVSCDSGTGIVSRSGEQNRRIPGSFLNARMMVLPQDAKDTTKRLIEFRVFKRGEGDVVAKDLTSLPSDRISGIDEIETTCTVRTNQCIVKRDENGKKIGCDPVYPTEIDQITINIPIDTVAVQPPEFALDAGLELSEDIIKFTEDLIPKFEKAFSLTFQLCVYSIAAVFAAKLATPIIKYFAGNFFDLADFIWYGPKGLRGVAFTTRGRSESNSFVISGRSMCAVAVCPKNWCRVANIQIGTEEIQEKLDLDNDGIKETPVWETNEKGEIKTVSGTDRRIPKNINQPITFGQGATRIQDSLLLSVGCGCISGILTKLYQLRAIAQEWNFCLNDARAGRKFTGQCDRLLNYGICTFVTQEVEAFFGTSFIKKAFGKLFGSGSANNLGGAGIEGSLLEAREADSLKGAAKQGKDDAKEFARGDLAELARTGAGGGVGYAELPIIKTICSLAIYKRLPNIDTFANFDLNRPFIGTSVSINWNSKVSHITPLKEPVFEYQIDWMILAGRDNMRYEIYLKNPGGGRSQLLNKEIFLDRAGDHDSGYLQFLDKVDYTEACVNIPSEAKEDCFPPGRGGSGIIAELTGYGEDDFADADKDGMSDDWENANKLNPNDANDALLDNDRDGRTNVREFREGTDPNVADLGTAYSSETVKSDCRAVFNKDITFKGASSDIPAYKYGDKIEVVNENLIDIERPEKDVEIKVEILGRASGFRETKRFIAHDIEDGLNFNVWNIPEARIGVDVPPTDQYNLKFSLIKSGTLSDQICTDATSRTTNSIKEKSIVIYDPAFSGCNDFGGRDIGKKQACIYTDNGVKVEREACGSDGDRKLIEYSCVSEQCVAETVFCPEGSACQDGRCVLRKEVIPAVATPAAPAQPVTPEIQEEYSTEPTVGGVFTETKNPGGETYVYIKNTVNEVFGNENALPLILGMITQESGGNKQARSPAGAVGLMQIMPDAEADVNLELIAENPFAPEKSRSNWKDNVYIGVRYFKIQLDKYKSIELALAAYNAGPTKVNSKCQSKPFNECKSSLPSETQNYVPAVLGHAEAWRRELTAVAST
ncbi:lytic transglycosylase domain-containing protein [Candidatus Woesearchaeota archaeon]|nr:lytic transglycosylase domain-containing protein [Candidatus Woesearchaeota archaeon]